MDHTRDFPKFKRLLAQLCAAFDKPLSEELVEGYWTALRHAPLLGVEQQVHSLLAKASDGTRFPKPSQLRPEGVSIQLGEQVDYQRAYWRSMIVGTVAFVLQTRGIIREYSELESLIVRYRDTLGARLRDLLDEVDLREKREGMRTWSLGDHAYQQARRIAELWQPTYT